MKVSLIACLVLLAGLYTHYPVLEDRYSRSRASFDFSYRSEVLPGQKNHTIQNSITNHMAKDPVDKGKHLLTVVWKKGRIWCTGTLQLPPQETDSVKIRNVYDPFDDPNAPLKFGVDLSKTFPGQAYLEKKSQAQVFPPRVTDYVRTDTDGTTSARITLSSSINPNGKAIHLFFSVTSGLNLGIPMKLGGFLKGNEQLQKSKTWKLAEVASVEDFGLADGTYRSVVRDWLRTNDQVGYFNFVILQNLAASGTNKLDVELQASRWTSEEIFVIAFDPKRTGILGLAATVYVPAAS